MTVVGQIARAPWPIVAALGLHLLVALVCACAMISVEAAPILGLHPAVKPLKFAVSIAILLASVAWILVVLETDARLKLVLASLIASTMVVEMIAIAVQALRGVPSHFGTSGRLDAAIWSTMLLAIVIATVALLVLIGVATVRPWKADPAIVLAGRAGLWILLLAVVSGFAMGGRLAHSVGGHDGGPGYPISNWSRVHGDLRVSHFFALHALQVLPLTAWVVSRLGLGDRGARVVVVVATACWLGLSLFTLGQALAGRPLLRGLAP